MSIRFTNFIGVLVLTAASSLLASSAIAQTSASFSDIVGGESIPDTFDRAFFFRSGDVYRNRPLRRQAQLIFGFPEREFTQDALLTEILYRDVLDQQVSSDRIIRTPDLNNPFNTTLYTNPALLPAGE
ncbi:MAG: hypothetical protein KME08_19695 [Aphanothece sp. CMT-3BRIN-NPC111]|jgi:hypothetical protein|nr:hypothetical protein [Aphanothece sp. CMT-3BRIN-NPC111]